MADKKTVDKVKELLDGHVYAPLKETAEKWLNEADEKYDVKEKAGKAWDKLNEAAESFAESSGKFNEKMNEAGEKFTAGAEKLAEKAGPAVDQLKEKAGPAVDQLKEKAAPTVDKLKEKASPALDKVSESELIAKLKEGIATVNETIEHFSDPKVRENFGEEAAEQIKKHAEALKAEGKKYCDCPACTKAREILKDLGVELEEGGAEENAAEESAPEASAPEASVSEEESGE
jgi:uncharacterized phage infection (PIP) family protein YhgE